MMTVEQVKEALADRRIPLVSEATGLHYNTIKNIRDGITTDPGSSTLKKLSDYLEPRQ